MARYIDADDAIKVIRDIKDNCDSRFYGEALIDAQSEILALPTADVAEVKHGEWIGKPIAGYARIRCSVCRTSFAQETGTWVYCPECGAKMDGGKI